MVTLMMRDLQRHLKRAKWGLALLGAWLICASFALAPAFESARAEGLMKQRHVLELGEPGQVGRIRLTINQSQTLNTDRPYSQGLIANPEIADVVVLTDQSIYIIGKKIGLTRLTMLDASKHMLGVIEIEVSFDLKGLRNQILQSAPGSQVKISTTNGRIVLSGVATDAVALANIVNITEQYTAGCETVSNVAPPSSAQASAAAPPAPAKGATSVTASGPASELAAAGLLPAAAPSGTGAGKCFISLMTVRGAQEVLLEVRFVEAKRTAERDLGLAWDTATSGFRARSGVSPEPSQPFLTGASTVQAFATNSIPFGTFVAQILNNGTKADALIQALEKKGVARRLAEPNLVTLSGETANFLAGGEYPFPVAQSGGTAGSPNLITLDFKKFGVSLAFTPTVLAHGQINLKIEPEVSDIDPTQAVAIGGGLTVPTLVVRRANTTVELMDGQSFAIAGLIQTTHTKDASQLPWLGSVPVLGALFKSDSYTKAESDLVIIVTPHLVQPATPGQHLATPFDEKLASNDRDFFADGKMEIPDHAAGPHGHILDLDSSWAAHSTEEASHAPAN